jgi:release factor glutamine methyltransferase
MHENKGLTVREALKQASSLLMRVFAERAMMRDGGNGGDGTGGGVGFGKIGRGGGREEEAPADGAGPAPPADTPARADDAYEASVETSGSVSMPEGAARADDAYEASVEAAGTVPLPDGTARVIDADVAASGVTSSHMLPEPAVHAVYADEARADAEVLLMHMLGWDKTRLLLEGDTPFPAGLLDRWRDMLARRAAGEPVQHITGEQEFYGMSFEVGPAVLIPRPETELLVEAVAKRVRALFGPDDEGRIRRDALAGLSSAGRHGPDESGGPAERMRCADRTGRTQGRAFPADGGKLSVRLLADIGTGSGAIAITLARLLPGWRVAACDLSPDALEIARRNARRVAMAEGGRITAGQDVETAADFTGRIRFFQGDLLEPLIASGERVDVLVSNPPYIPSGDLARLQPEVRDHEPRLALDGGPDGLDVYRRIVRQIGRLSEPPRLVAFEVGQGQARAVAAMLADTGWWPGLEIVRDYAGIERHVLVWRP